MIVDYHDPFVPVIPMTREHAKYVGRKSVHAITDTYDALLLATHHDVYKSFDFSAFTCPLVDTRNCVTMRPENYHMALASLFQESERVHFFLNKLSLIPFSASPSTSLLLSTFAKSLPN